MSASLLVFIPAKNEASTIRDVVTDVRSTFQQAGHAPHILVIDDGSTDDTQTHAEQAGAQVIRHPRSQGLGRAFEEAHQFALHEGYETLLTIDGDNQFLADDLLRIYQTMQREGADFVSGSRFLSNSQVNNMPSMRRHGNLLLAKMVTSITKRPITDSTCGLRGYSRKALAALHTFSAFTYTHEVVLNLGLKPLRFAEVPITVRYYSERVSRIARNLFGYGWKTTFILLKSLLLYQPARLFGGLAAPFLAVGIPLVTVLGIRFLLTDTVSPYKSLGIFGLVASVTGLMLITAGILLQMLAWMQSTLEQLLYEQRRGPRQ